MANACTAHFQPNPVHRLTAGVQQLLHHMPARPRQPLDVLCLAQIARFKRPKRYEIVASRPKNHYGKVLKTELCERLKSA